MSYDVWLTWPGGQQIAGTNFNMTSNVAAVFYNHMKGGIPALDGKTGFEASIMIADFWEKFDRTRINLWSHNVVGEPKLRQKYDASNGWGSVESALCFIGKIAGACAKYPNAITRVSA